MTMSMSDSAGNARGEGRKEELLSLASEDVVKSWLNRI